MAEVGVGLGYDMIKKITVNILSNDANNIIYIKSVVVRARLAGNQLRVKL